MPKRFFATELWAEDWFLEMPAEYKLFWFYILAECDHAGLFKVNVKKFKIITGKNIGMETAIHWFNLGKNRIRRISGKLWLIEDFFNFQYGSTMNLNSKVHESVQKAYIQANISLTSIRGLKDLKDRVKDKDIDKEKKGGMGENKNVYGLEFTDDGFAVVLTNGEIQKLGQGQILRKKEGTLQPHYVKLGLIE
jgi:hypothetical protein